MSFHTHTLPMSILALLLLAGCGGGGSHGSTAASSNGTAGTGTATAGTSAGTTTTIASPDPANGIPTGKVTASVTSPAYNPAGASTQVPATVAIDGGSISGDVLATMLTQQTRTANSTDNLTDAFPQRAAVPWSATAPGGQPLSGSDAPNIHAFQMMYRQARPGSFVWQGSNFWRYNLPWGAFNFNGLTLQFNLDVGLPAFRLNANEIQFDQSGVVARDALLMSIPGTLDAGIIPETREGKQPVEKQISLAAAQPYNIRQGARIPFNQAIHSWRRDADTHVDLMVLKGAGADEVRTCFNIILPPDLKRLACTVWRVPANWFLGQRLAFRGNYIVDDRSLQAGESGHLIWQTPY